MILRKGNMWDAIQSVNDIVVITTNSFVKKDDRLVMGRGIALEAKKRYPGIDLDFGKTIKEFIKVYKTNEYNLIRSMNKNVWAFQVKYNWWDNADFGLIRRSTNRLNTMIKTLPYSSCTIHLNFPGIGNGRLKREKVLPIVKTLPDNVNIWELK